MSELVQVLCTRPNASDCINGVAFHPVEGGMLSEPIPRDTADLFCDLAGYRIVEGDAPRRGRKPSPA